MFNLANTLVAFQFDLAPLTLLALPGVGWFLPCICMHRKKNYLLIAMNNNKVTPKQDEVENFIKLDMLEIKLLLEESRSPTIALWFLYDYKSSSTFKKHKLGSANPLFWEVSSSLDLNAWSLFWNTAALFLMVGYDCSGVGKSLVVGKFWSEEAESSSCWMLRGWVCDTKVTSDPCEIQERVP